MKKIHIEHSSGVAGDMLLAALLDLSEDLASTKKHLIDELTKLNLGEDVVLDINKTQKKGISAKNALFKTSEDDWVQKTPTSHSHSHSHSHHPHVHSHMHPHAHSHTHQHAHSRNFTDIKKLIEQSRLSDKIKKGALDTFHLLARAEATVHDSSVANVHFHEVGSLDAILEIVGVWILIEKLDVTSITSTPLVLGRGFVNCQHGKMPVPVPAVTTMLSMVNAPFIQTEEITGELTTPTGAALTLTLAENFTTANNTTAQKLTIGYGAGIKDIDSRANILRIYAFEGKEKQDFNNLFDGEKTSNSNIDPLKSDATKYPENQLQSKKLKNESLIEITSTIDDMTGEQISILQDSLISLGAKDVILHPVIMKKGRTGHKVEVLCTRENRFRLIEHLLNNSSTLGIRHTETNRLIVERKTTVVSVSGLDFTVKIAYRPDGSKTYKVEDHSIRNALLKSKKNLTLMQVTELVDLAIKKVKENFQG